MILHGKVMCQCRSTDIGYGAHDTNDGLKLAGHLVCQECGHHWKPSSHERRKINALLLNRAVNGEVVQ